MCTIWYPGGLSDVGRHAILAALEKKDPSVDKITVITEYPEKLNEKNWDSAGEKSNPFDDPDAASKLEMVKIDTWKNDQPNLSKHFVGATAVVSCLGHRQPGWKNKELISKGLVAYDGNKQVIAAMKEANVNRVVVISSFGINGDKDWPHLAGKLMRCLFMTFMRKARKDLEKMEDSYTGSELDYLIVRPVGIGEDVEESGKYYLQESGSKNKDGMVGGNMAKMDVSRFMVDEALKPTLHRCSKTVGAKPGTPM